MFASGGKLYWNIPGEAPQPVVVDGKHLDAPDGVEGSVSWTPGDTAIMVDMSQQITELSNRITQLENEYNNTTDEKHKAAIIQQRDALIKQREEFRQQLRDNPVQVDVQKRRRSQSKQRRQHKNSNQPKSIMLEFHHQVHKMHLKLQHLRQMVEVKFYRKKNMKTYCVKLVQES